MLFKRRCDQDGNVGKHHGIGSLHLNVEIARFTYFIGQLPKKDSTLAAEKYPFTNSECLLRTK